MKLLPVAAVAMLAATATVAPRAQQGGRDSGGEIVSPGEVTVLTPTAHPPMPRELAAVWFAPDRGSTGQAGPLTNATRAYISGDYARAQIAAQQASTRAGPLAMYATYYSGLSQLSLGKAAEALKTFRLLIAQKPVGYLAEAAALAEADALVALDKPGDAVKIYDRMLDANPSSFDDVLMRLGRAAKAAGDLSKAADAFGRVYYEFALGEAATAAGTELALIPLRNATPNSGRFKLELGRAERLFGARRYKDARDAFADIESLASGEDREVVRLRLAEADYFLKRTPSARERLKSLLDGRVSRRAEALYFYAVAARDLGDAATYLSTSRRVVDEFREDSWAQESLNGLGTYYILRNDDDEADKIFRELLAKFPAGRHAERAAWKVGWRAYRQGKYEDTVRVFEQASVNFPRSDYRPSWLYWAARAHEKLSNRSLASLRHAIVVADYMHSYYGRLSVARLGASASAATRAIADSIADDIPLPSEPPPNTAVIRALLGAEMYEDALKELRYARRTWGDSPAIQATVAWTHQQQSRGAKGMAQFQLARGAINDMRRAYPQFMTAGGDSLPYDVQTVIFPLAYWEFIKRYSAQHALDPYLMAALVLQESTFVADIRSHANAYGLMQLLPSTARQYARKLQIPYSPQLLTNPEANIRMGTAYFADKIREFGSVHLALASYNAGETAVRRWISERKGLDQDEFIDDIPYPETQGYVRKILGMASDYRRLYGDVDASTPDKPRPTTAPSAKPPAAAAPGSKAPAVKPPAAPSPKRTPARPVRRPRAA